MNSMYFLISTLLDLYIVIVLFRVWLQWSHADFYNPFSQFVVKITQPVVTPLRRIIPSIGGFDLASVLFVYVLCIGQSFVLQMIMLSAILPFNESYLLIGLITMVKTAGKLLFWVLIIRSLLSWVNQGRHPIQIVIIQLTEPLVAPIRRRLPSLGGLDLSILVPIIMLQFLNYFIGDLLTPYFAHLWFGL
ncbi:YggT family protein [Candidatus Enterovibrio escicola]|uniref:Integral membrane protein YggT n=3 Tax=Candidatus Enterovibrio escicola TaxID=1927127 RepID=A0A2A5T5F4_9GAMM|nr:YggT family protein [Candidatus Enterovibrio escacola]PCS23392.1 Integral membrane protein YggT [Candidatus Enterovibrio escacola]